MKVKGIISEEKVTLPEFREVVLGVESERLAAEKEMSYEFRRSIEHANQLSKTTPEKSRDLVAALVKMEKMNRRSRIASQTSCQNPAMKCVRSSRRSGTRSLLKNSIQLSNW